MGDWVCDRCSRHRTWASVKREDSILWDKVTEARSRNSRADLEGLLADKLAHLHDGHYLRYACHKHISLKCPQILASPASAVGHFDSMQHVLLKALPFNDPAKVVVYQWQAAMLLEVCKQTPAEPRPSGPYKAALRRLRAAFRSMLESSIAC